MQLVPHLQDALIIRSWSGIDGGMPDNLPVMGPSRTTPGLIHAFGFSGHGAALTTLMGELDAVIAAYLEMKEVFCRELGLELSTSEGA